MFSMIELSLCISFLLHSIFCSDGTKSVKMRRRKNVLFIVISLFTCAVLFGFLRGRQAADDEVKSAERIVRGKVIAVQNNHYAAGPVPPGHVPPAQPGVHPAQQQPPPQAAPPEGQQEDQNTLMKLHQEVQRRQEELKKQQQRLDEQNQRLEDLQQQQQLQNERWNKQQEESERRRVQIQQREQQLQQQQQVPQLPPKEEVQKPGIAPGQQVPQQQKDEDLVKRQQEQERKLAEMKQEHENLLKKQQQLREQNEVLKQQQQQPQQQQQQLPNFQQQLPQQQQPQFPPQQQLPVQQQPNFPQQYQQLPLQQQLNLQQQQQLPEQPPQFQQGLEQQAQQFQPQQPQFPQQQQQFQPQQQPANFQPQQQFPNQQFQPQQQQPLVPQQSGQFQPQPPGQFQPQQPGQFQPQQPVQQQQFQPDLLQQPAVVQHQINQGMVEQHGQQLHKDKIHLSVVTCGDRLEETTIMLKSATIFTQSPMHFHIFIEDELKEQMTTRLNSWAPEYRRKFSFTLYPITFPAGENPAEWKKVFKLCATQRLFLPDLLLNVDSVLYVDTDILFMRPLEKIWAYFKEFNSTQFAAMTPEHEITNIGWYNRFGRHPYYGLTGLNSGVMLMNLTRMRKFDWTKKIVPLYKEYKTKITWGDQDLINILFYFHPECVFVYPCEWNFRPDHCMYSLNCPRIKDKGVSVIHGNRGVYHNEKQLPFRAIYEAFRDYEFGTDLETGLVQGVRQRFANPNLLNMYCTKALSIPLIESLQETVNSVNAHRLSHGT